MGNGIYDYATTTAQATGAANTDAALFTRNIAGGGLADGNCLRWRAEFDGTGTASFRIGSTDILIDPWPIEGIQRIIELEVWRTGPTTALVRPWTGQGGGNEAMVPGGRFPVTGLAWGQSQAFTIVGRSSVANGLTLERAGLAK